MADTLEYFNEILPAKIASDPDLVESVHAVFQFDIEGAGIWTVDLLDEGRVTEGPTENAGCVITVNKENWEKVMTNPAVATQLFMLGKLKASDLGLAMKLQQILA